MTYDLYHNIWLPAFKLLVKKILLLVKKYYFKGGIHIAEVWPWEQERLQQSEGKGIAGCSDAWGIKQSQVRDKKH